LHGVERRDPQDDVQARLLVKVAEHFTRLVRVEVSHHNGLDLRVLKADHIGNGTRFHPLEAIQAAGVATQQDAVDQAVGLVFAQGRGEHFADIAVRAHAEAGLVADDLDEFAHHLLDLLAVHVAHLRHRHTHPLDLLGAHVAQHLGGIGFAQRQEQNGGLVDPGQLGIGGGAVITHRH